MFEILYYSDLNTKGLESKFDKVMNFLKDGDFKSADVKKMKPTNLLRAKLDVSNRVIFTYIKYSNKVYLLILEIIRNHEYEKSRFLRGKAIVNESNFLQENIENEVLAEDIPTLKFLFKDKPVYFLDKFIMFDFEQSDIFDYNLPIILIGSAGSGKTSLMLEKMKLYHGNILYVSLSSYLVHNTRQLYYSNNYENESQEVDFLSFKELLETIKVLNGSEIQIKDFLNWFYKLNKSRNIEDGRKLFEEFKGVITGAHTDKNYLSEDEYLSLGVKQSIYPETDRPEVYQIFKKYLLFLEDNNCYDINIEASKYINYIKNKYDIIFVDEVQDFTNKQIALVLKCLAKSDKFFFCGDANQIVHPNFFSWSKLKSFLYKTDDLNTKEVTSILTKNYRNSPQVIELANRVLKLKNYKFKSIDKESHFLVESTSSLSGIVTCIESNSPLVKELNLKTSKSIKYAVLVLHENDKILAKQVFNTPLIFTPQEAKGLEYENVIIFNFISNEKKFLEIAKGVGKEYLSTDFTYSRAKEKEDKSLEVYKFYINSFYVVITRAIKNIYLIESNVSNPFIELLNIEQIQKIIIQEEKSSIQDWEAEASKLARQGKVEQMQAIEEQILKHSSVPWKVVNHDEYLKIQNQILLKDPLINKKNLIFALNYSFVYSQEHFISKLKNYNIKQLENIPKFISIMEDEFFSEYQFKNTKALFDKVNKYGINYRNIFNFTPLMAAVYMANEVHAREILNRNADINLLDNLNRNAFQIFLSVVGQKNRSMPANKIGEFYNMLVPESISVNADDRLIKIDSHKIEFIFVNIILFCICLSYDEKNIPKFKSLDIISKLSCFKGSNIFIDSRVLNRSYISQVLSRNEIDSKYPYSRKLFKRDVVGVYILNPELKFKLNDNWLLLKNFFRS